MPDIKFECASCGQSIEAPQEMLGMQVACPGCGNKVKVMPQPAQPVESRDAPSKIIRDRAENVSVFGLICFGIGGILFFLSILIGLNAQGGDSKPMEIVALIAGGLLGMAFFLIVIAQLLHIRAALEKLSEK